SPALRFDRARGGARGLLADGEDDRGRTSLGEPGPDRSPEAAPAAGDRCHAALQVEQALHEPARKNRIVTHGPSIQVVVGGCQWNGTGRRDDGVVLVPEST